MIPPIELRPGNIVQGPPFSIPRESITSNGLTWLCPYGVYLAHEGKISYDPVPLTPEILTKCGLVSKGNWGTPHYYIDRLCIKDLGTGEYCFSWGRSVYDKLPGTPATLVMHLHQLQNLYFALTGKELTVII